VRSAAHPAGGQIFVGDGGRAHRQENVKFSAGATLLIETGTLDPDSAAVRFDDALGNGQAEAGAGAHEFCGAGRVQGGTSHAEEFLKHQFVITGRDAHAGVDDNDFDGFRLVAVFVMLADDLDTAPVGRELDSVADDLPEGLV